MNYFLENRFVKRRSDGTTEYFDLKDYEQVIEVSWFPDEVAYTVLVKDA